MASVVHSFHAGLEAQLGGLPHFTLYRGHARFEAPREREAPTLPDELRRIAEAARPHYEALRAHRLSPA